ncbi:conserved phage C-terminal domain-containing protein [Limosilactobacillus oris]|uniref:conserved phage C-terminal domain-containing protein n=1 Tax=Limosilactobacillus oris TaxID=1632 RepID=UPI00265A4321|nr:conserved phage C-terminal domain-containing protein [Limosilactobacillus oris]
MTKMRKIKTNHITILDQDIVRNSKLSWKARGIFAYLWSQADQWDFNELEVARHATDGKDALHSGLKELERFGYLERKRARNAEGQVGASEWFLHECPKPKSPKADYPTQENPAQGNPMQGKPTQGNPQQSNINSKKHQIEDNIKESNSQAEPDSTAQLREKIIGYLNEKLGTKYKPNASKNKTVINARLKEGYSLDDFKTVVDNKIADWSNSPKMSKFLRPETLFGPKFDGYLSEKRINQKPNTHQGKDWFAGFNRE